MSKITKKQLQNIINEELENALVDEGIFSAIGKGAGKIAGAFSDLKKGYQQGKGEGDPAQLAADKKMAQVALFIQAAERELRSEILATQLGDKLFQTEMMNEQYGEKQLFQMMKSKGITPQQVDEFISAMQKIPKAKEFLKLAGLDGAAPAAGEPSAEPAAGEPAAAGEPSAEPAAGEPAAAGEPSAEPAAAGEPAAPQVFNVEKGKASLQQQLLQKYGSQLGPEANKFIAAIVRDIKSDLGASGIKVQESVEQIGDRILTELFLDKEVSSLLFEAATQADVEALRDEIKRLEAAKKNAPPEARNFQEKELEKLKAKKEAAEAEVRAGVDKAKADKEAAKLAASEKAQKARQRAVKTMQTKRVSKPGVVDINQAVFSKLAALKNIHPKLAGKLDALTPQIMKAVLKYVNYAISKSGKTGEVKVLAKPTAPASPAAPLAESKELQRWKQLAKING